MNRTEIKFQLLFINDIIYYLHHSLGNFVSKTWLWAANSMNFGHKGFLMHDVLFTCSSTLTENIHAGVYVRTTDYINLK